MPSPDGILLGPGPLAVAVTKPYDATYLWQNGDYCTNNGKIYKFIGEDLIAGEAWTAAHWSEIKLTDAILNLQDQIDAMNPESATGVFLDVAFTINTNQWTEDNGTYSYILSNALIKASSGIAVYYDDTFRTALSGDIKVQKYTGYVTFITTGAPAGQLTGTLRIIQSVSGILPVAKGGTGAATAKGARSNLNAPIKPIELSFGTVTSLPQTVYDDDINEYMVPIKWVFSDPSACPQGLTITINGSGTPSATIGIEGTQTFSGETTVTVYLQDKKTRDDDATNQQQEQYVGDFVQVGAQTLTVQQKAQARTNIGAANAEEIGDVPSGKTVQSQITELNSKLTSNISHTVVNKPITFNGKSLVLFGDSIAKGFASNPLQQITDCWANLFEKKSGAILTNKAYSGKTLATRDGATHSVVEEVIACTTTADVVIIAGGTNDFGLEVPVGEYDDAVTTTVYGALNSICSTIKSSNYLKKATVIFVTPISRTDIITTADALRFEEIRNAIYEIATKNGFYVIDGRDLGFPDKRGDYQQDVMYDHVHPTVQGHQMYADAMAGILLTDDNVVYLGAVSSAKSITITASGQVDFMLFMTGGSTARDVLAIGRLTATVGHLAEIYKGSDITLTISDNTLTISKSGSGASIVFLTIMYGRGNFTYS